MATVTHLLNVLEMRFGRLISPCAALFSSATMTVKAYQPSS